EAGYGLSLWASVSALAAIVTGLQLAGVTRVEPGVITGHAGFGIASGIAVTALAVVRYSAHAREQRGYRMPWLVLEIGAAALIDDDLVTQLVTADQELDGLVCRALFFLQSAVIDLNDDIILGLLRVSSSQLQLDICHPRHLVLLGFLDIEFEEIAFTLLPQVSEFTRIPGDLLAQRRSHTGDFPAARGKVGRLHVQV